MIRKIKAWRRVLFIALLITNFQAPVRAQIPIADIIKAAVTKVIKAVDLQIQRLQNNTIRLQNAQKAIENTLSKLKLGEIGDWVEKQRALYANYYEELSKVRTAIQYYREIKSIIQKQIGLVGEYKVAVGIFQQDKNFTPDELDDILQVCEGILTSSMHNLDLLIMVASSFKTQMTDAKRMLLIRQADEALNQNIVDLRRFTASNSTLSLQRAKDLQEIATVKALYGQALR